MFCPKCGSELVYQDGELTCITGDMGLSRYMEQTLTERYIRHTPAEHRVNAASTNHDPWYCPGCGIPPAQDLVCPSCHVSLADLQRHLVELHPHKTADGRCR